MSNDNDTTLPSERNNTKNNNYYLVSNTRMVVFLYDSKDNALNFQVVCLESRLNLVLDTTIPGYQEATLNKLLTYIQYKDEIDEKSKVILDKFGYQYIKTAKFLNEEKFEDFIRAEIWPNFNYTKTDLAKASYYLPKDDSGNYSVDINIDLEDIAFYQNVLKCERLLNN